MKDTFL